MQCSFSLKLAQQLDPTISNIYVQETCLSRQTQYVFRLDSNSFNHLQLFIYLSTVEENQSSKPLFQIFTARLMQNGVVIPVFH